MGLAGSKACSWNDVLRFHPGTDPRIYALRAVHKIPNAFIRYYPPSKYRSSQANEDLRQACRGGTVTPIPKFHKMFRGSDPRDYVFEKVYGFPRKLVPYMRKQTPWYTVDMAMAELARKDRCRRLGVKKCAPAYELSFNPSARYRSKSGKLDTRRFDAKTGGYTSGWNTTKLFPASKSMARQPSQRPPAQAQRPPAQAQRPPAQQAQRAPAPAQRAQRAASGRMDRVASATHGGLTPTSTRASQNRGRQQWLGARNRMQPSPFA